jgi:cob(I)alamin adenosyltransferase
MKNGFIHVYTGNGKGKTTAALGLAMRAAGAGLRVFFAQFVKGQDYSELHSFARMADRITLRQYGAVEFVLGCGTDDDARLAARGLVETRQAIASHEYDVVVMDEVNMAVFLGLIPLEDLMAILNGKPEQVELVITGRYAAPQVLAKADLVTEMREVKHYYHSGIIARPGIEN